MDYKGLEVGDRIQIKVACGQVEQPCVPYKSARGTRHVQASLGAGQVNSKR
jgi:hypothetical protein